MQEISEEKKEKRKKRRKIKINFYRLYCINIYNLISKFYVNNKTYSIKNLL